MTAVTNDQGPTTKLPTTNDRRPTTVVMIAILMGVSGSGKTTIGRLLAERLGWSFYDGDDLHPPANVEKMRHGIPLTDADRAPWLEAVRAVIEQVVRQGRSAVLAC